jgi:hypothetical protein
MVGAQESNKSLKDKLAKIKSGEMKPPAIPEDNIVLPPIESSKMQNKVSNEEYFKEVYSKHVDSVERLEKKLGYLKKSNESPQKRYKKVRELVPYEQMFESAMDNCKSLIKARKCTSMSCLSSEKGKKLEDYEVNEDKISRTDKMYRVD